MKQGKKREHPTRSEDDIYPLAVNLTKAARVLNVSRPTLRTRILSLLDWHRWVHESSSPSSPSGTF
jgi:hypothetical protein